MSDSGAAAVAANRPSLAGSLALNGPRTVYIRHLPSHPADHSLPLYRNAREIHKYTQKNSINRNNVCSYRVQAQHWRYYPCSGSRDMASQVSTEQWTMDAAHCTHKLPRVSKARLPACPVLQCCGGWQALRGGWCGGAALMGIPSSGPRLTDLGPEKCAMPSRTL